MVNFRGRSTLRQRGWTLVAMFSVPLIVLTGCGVYLAVVDKDWAVLICALVGWIGAAMTAYDVERKSRQGR